MEKKEVTMKGMMKATDVGEYLASIAQGLRDGNVVVESGEEMIILKPSELIEMEIEATQKKDKEKIEIEITWRKSSMVENSVGSVRITSVAPESNGTAE